MDTSKLEAKLKEMIKTEAAEGNKKKPVKFDEKIESLIDIALEDGMLTDKERELLLRKAQEAGIDTGEFEMVLDARLAKLQKKNEKIAEKKLQEKKEKSKGVLGTIGFVAVLVIGFGIFYAVDYLSDKKQDEAETAIRNNDLTTAYDIMKKDDEIKNNLAEVYTNKCLELNEFDMADAFYNSFNAKSYDSLSLQKKETVRKNIYDYCMQNNNYEKTEKYTKFYSQPNPNSNQYVEEHYAYIIDVVTSMCKAGKKEEAKNFAMGLIEKYEWQEKQFFKDNKYTKEAVADRISEFINKY